MRTGIEDRRRGAGKIAGAFRLAGYGGENIVRIIAARADVAAEKKRLHAAVINVRNIQRAADGDAKAVLVVIGLVFRQAIEGERLGIERRAAEVIEDGAMRPVDIKVAEV